MVKYVVYGVPSGFAASYVLTRFIKFDLLILNFHLQNLWLLIPETFIVFGGVYIWNWSRKSEKKKRKKQAQEQLKKLILEAGGSKRK